MRQQLSKMKKITGEKLRDFILGAQDGIVNVLGLVLGVAAATFNTEIVLVSGIAGLVAESISMGAVAYTSSKAAHDYFKVKKEKKEENVYKNPAGIALFVFLATIFGSIIPVIPFFLMPVKEGIFASVALCGLVLFAIGMIKGKLTTDGWKSGFEMLIIGLVAALAGYFIVLILGNIIKVPIIIP